MASCPFDKDPKCPHFAETNNINNQEKCEYCKQLKEEIRLMKNEIAELKQDVYELRISDNLFSRSRCN